MQVFKRFSTALKAAGEQDIIAIQIGRETVFIVPGADYHEAVAQISVMTPTASGLGGGRTYAGYVTPRHLKRLGNANWAVSKDDHAATQKLLSELQRDNAEADTVTITGTDIQGRPFAVRTTPITIVPVKK